MANQMSPAELGETAKRLRKRLEISGGMYGYRSDLQAGADALDRLADVIDLHIPQHGSQGYLPDGKYGWIDEVCPQCGHADEYGIESPCPTLRIARGDTTDEEELS